MFTHVRTCTYAHDIILIQYPCLVHNVMNWYFSFTLANEIRVYEYMYMILLVVVVVSNYQITIRHLYHILCTHISKFFSILFYQNIYKTYWQHNIVDFFRDTKYYNISKHVPQCLADIIIIIWRSYKSSSSLYQQLLFINVIMNNNPPPSRPISQPLSLLIRYYHSYSRVKMLRQM